MGNIPSYSHLTQCIRKRKTLHSQQLIDIDSHSDSDNNEKIIFYNREATVIRKDDSLKKKKKIPQAVRNNYEMMGVDYW